MATAKPKTAAKAVAASKTGARVPLTKMRDRMKAAAVPVTTAAQDPLPVAAPAPIMATEPAPWDDAPATPVKALEMPGMTQAQDGIAQAHHALEALAALGIKPQQTPVPTPAPAPVQPPAQAETPTKNDLDSHPVFANLGQGIQPVPIPQPAMASGNVYAGHYQALGTAYPTSVPLPPGAKPAEVKNTHAVFASHNSRL